MHIYIHTLSVSTQSNHWELCGSASSSLSEVWSAKSWKSWRYQLWLYSYMVKRLKAMVSYNMWLINESNTDINYVDLIIWLERKISVWTPNGHLTSFVSFSCFYQLWMLLYWLIWASVWEIRGVGWTFADINVLKKTSNFLNDINCSLS